MAADGKSGQESHGPTGGWISYHAGDGMSLVHPQTGHRVHAKTDGRGRRYLVAQGRGEWSIVCLDDHGQVIAASYAPTQQLAWDILHKQMEEGAA